MLNFLNWIVKVAVQAAVGVRDGDTRLLPKMVEETRSQRQALAFQADALAAVNLDVEDEEPRPAPALLLVSALQSTTQERCPAPGTDAYSLLTWVHMQRQAQVGWAEIARRAQ